ncbi:MAG: DUF4249 domain-containing protein [Bacteroidota bacterium]
MAKFIQHIIVWCCFVFLFAGCEKEIDIDVDPSTPVLVVEASINQYSPILNYVFLTTSIDYFTPDLTLGGIEGATVYIYEGTVVGTDTLYLDANRVQLFSIGSVNIPVPDSIARFLQYVNGIYFNPFFMGKENTAYKLDITLTDGRRVEGYTYIPKVVPITSMYYEITGEPNKKGLRNALLSFSFTDPPEQNNYRIALKKGGDSLAIGWGNADTYRTFDDALVNGVDRTYPFAGGFEEMDTINLYFSTIGRKEFLFWQSFGSASNSGNPFSTPAILKSNLTGATGSFTGYGVSFKQLILK